MQESFGKNGKALSALVAAAITVYTKNHKDVSMSALSAIIYLCRNDGVNINTCCDHNVQRLGSNGACDAAVGILKLYGCVNSDVAFRGCWAILNLSSNDSNNIKLGNAGASDIVIEVLKKYGCSIQDVALFGCRAVCNLAVNGVNQTKLRVGGASDIIVEVLKKFGTINSDIALFGCRAIINLAANKTKLGGSGLCECCVDILKKFGLTHSDVASEVCKAISFLGSNDSNNKGKFGLCGACEVVIDVLRKYGMTSSDCALYGSFAVYNLETQKNRIRMIGHGALDVVTAITKATSITEEARNKAKDALFKITEEKGPQNKLFGKDKDKKKEPSMSTIDGILEALQICQIDASKNDLAERCFNAIVNLVKNNKEQQELFGRHANAIQCITLTLTLTLPPLP